MENTTLTSNKRFYYLDGLRGIAAVIVVLCHFRLTFDDNFEARSRQWLANNTHSEFIAAILQPFINMISNGPLAVFIFWFMSGYVISVHLFKPNANQYLLGAFTKRYFRLAIPATASVLISYLLLKTGYIINQHFYAPGQTNQWLHVFYTFDANFWNAIKNGLWDTFFDYHENTSYNASLWTMNQELYGSFLCFFLFAVFRKHVKRYIVYFLVLLILFFQNNFALITFLCGFILCDMDFSSSTKNSILIWLEDRLFNKWYVSLGLLLAVLFFAGKKTHVDLRDMLSSSSIVFIITRTRFLKQFLSLGIFNWLGKISFSMYLLHLPVLCSLTCKLYNEFSGSHFSKVVLSCSISFMVILILSVLFTRWIDVPAIQWSNKIGNRFTKDED